MDKELSASMKKLNKENRRVIMKMEQYMESRYINEIAGEDILADMVGMALEYQERGEPFPEAIGGDCEAFCRELVRNSPRQSPIERVLSVLRWLMLFSMILMPSLWLIELIFPKYSPSEADGFLFTTRAAFAIKYYILMFILVIGWFFVRMYTYKPMKYVMGTYIGIFMLFFLFTDGVLRYIVKDYVISVNIIVWVAAFGAVLLLCDVLKRLAAITVAYRKRKKINKNNSAGSLRAVYKKAQIRADRKKRRGDRKDGYLVRETDPLHAISPYILPNRTDNEAVLTETVDMTNVVAYIEGRNADSPEFRYTFFHFICAALAKTITLRPKMNRFYSGHRLYDRKDLLFSFVVKRKFSDDGAEASATDKIDRERDVPPLDQIYEQVKKYVYSVRKSDKNDSTTDKMNLLLIMPRPILRFAMRVLRWLEYHGRYPKALMYDDPYYSSLFLSNLGSIKMSADYHHLANWGTNSIFVIIGEMKPMPFYAADGSVSVREAL